MTTNNNNKRIPISQLDEATDPSGFWMFGSKIVNGTLKSFKFAYGNFISLFGVSQEKGQDLEKAPSLKLFTDEVAILQYFTITSDDTYLYKFLDINGRYLFGVRRDDGSVDIVRGIPREVNVLLRKYTRKKEIQYLIDAIKYFSSDNVQQLTDIEGKILSLHDQDGTFIPRKIRLPKKVWEKVKLLIQNSVKDIAFLSGIFKTSESDISVQETTDKEGRLLSRYDIDGTFIPKKIRLPRSTWNQINKQIAESSTGGIDIGIEASNKYEFPFPERAVINIMSTRLPVSKIDEIPATFYYKDYQGNAFTDKCIIKGQGNSSAASERISIAVDFEKIKVRFGSMPYQDSFHIKSYVWDKLRGVSVWAYDYINEVLDTLPYEKRYPNNYLKLTDDPYTGGNGSLANELPTGANFGSKGFPVRMYWNGKFYGMYCLIYKKDRDNYEHKKDNANHIHLDGELGASSFWLGVINWTAFEVRNPKSLKTVTGGDYDGDNPTEITGDTSVDAFTTSVKEKIIRFSQAVPAIKANKTKQTFEEYFLPDTFPDYFIISQVCYNYDGFGKNWQWLTWDGQKIGISYHDWDSLLGMFFLGTFIVRDSYSEILGTSENLPSGLFATLYANEIKARYKELRDKELISVDHIMKSLEKWCNRVGYDNYKEDFALWPNTPSNRPSYINSDYWELVGNTTTAANYNDTTQYNAGDTVVMGSSSTRYRFRCLQTCIGEHPYTQTYPKYPAELGYYESLQRINTWLKLRIPFLDNYFEYNNN